MGYRVTLKEHLEDKFTVVFDCDAQDENEAEDKAEAEYPGWHIVLVTKI